MQGLASGSSKCKSFLTVSNVELQHMMEKHTYQPLHYTSIDISVDLTPDFHRILTFYHQFGSNINMYLKPVNTEPQKNE